MCWFSSKKLDTEPLELFEIAVKELTFDQLQLLKVLLPWLAQYAVCRISNFVWTLEVLEVTRDRLGEYSLKIVQTEQLVNSKKNTFAPLLQLA